METEKKYSEYGIEDIDMLIADREKFEDFVYTSIDDALLESKKRAEDKKLVNLVAELVGGCIPKPFICGCRAVIGRQLATSNFESLRFLNICNALGIEPLFFEYHGDKFVSRNQNKHSLGILTFFNGRNDDGSLNVSHVKIVDFMEYDGKKISEVNTVWGESIVSFHHNLFANVYPRISENYFFDFTEWLGRFGADASNFYTQYLALHLANGILFENFMLDEKELDFTKDIFLPTFIGLINKTGHKPLIVALEPTEIEGEGFWHFQPSINQSLVQGKNFGTIK